MKWKSVWAVLKRTGVESNRDNAQLLAAGLAFYTIISLIPLILIAAYIMGLVIDEGTAQNEILSRIRMLSDAQVADTVESMLKSTRKTGVGTVTVVSFFIFLYGASKVFHQLTVSLNAIWNKERTRKRGLKSEIRMRLMSLVMVLGLGAFVIVLSVMESVLRVAQVQLSPIIPHFNFGFWSWINTLGSLALATGLFSFLYRWLPEATIRWKDVWVGGIFTSVVFVIGKYLLSLYFAYSPMVSIYGAAGSFIVILLWVFFLAQSFLFGAELTWVYAHMHGSRKSHPI